MQSRTVNVNYLHLVGSIPPKIYLFIYLPICGLNVSYLFSGELSVSIKEPSGPFAGSGFVRLQTDFSRNITLVGTHTYQIECTSSIGIRPIWTRDGNQVPNSQPSMGTPGVYVTESTDRISTLVLQNLAQSLVGTYVCREGTEQDAESATFVITIGVVGMVTMSLL